MKKTIIAFAALASFAGLASAQSSVTLSGRVNAGVGKFVGTTDNRVLSNEWSGLIFSGVEDLGNGLSAGFKLNPRFNIVDGGTSGGSLPVNRDAAGNVTSTGGIGFGEKLVFLQSAFGKISLGTVSKPAFDAVSWSDVNGWYNGDNWAAIQGGADSAWESSASRMDRAARYEYNANGLYAGVALSDKNKAGETNALATEMPVSVGASFNALGFKVGIGHDRGRVKSTNQQNWTVLGLGYSMPGLADFGASYGQGKDSIGAKRQAAQIGAAGNVGAVRVALTYADIRNTPVATIVTPDPKAVKVSQVVTLGAKYSLSKRTSIFGDVAYDKAVKDANKNNAAVNANRLAVGYSLGIAHSF
ncbi:porin [Amphibiibacter pelophylacis]|uniref:Porin n=1 Tax=Amphibiibacter pelophylacis TaxID=1799477 RepID=A0ACC6P432_9BURK